MSTDPTTRNRNEDKPWSEMDLFDLRNCLERGDAGAEIAEFLMRREDEIEAKARELHQAASRGLPTVDKLRHDIDRGRAGDKVNVVDPAAAPLGTDEEAAGTPVPPHAIDLAYRNEVRETSSLSSEHRGRDYAVPFYVGVILAIGTTLGAAIWLSA